jgi:predicted nucleic-acid-binding protein
MRIVADTNILVRAVVRDDLKQARAANKILKDAELIAVTIPCLCEFVWVLQRVYGFGRAEIVAAIEALIDSSSVVVNRPAVDAGLAIFDDGGDFADGVIAHEGGWLGGETFVSFERKAVALLAKRGQEAKLLT